MDLVSIIQNGMKMDRFAAFLSNYIYIHISNNFNNLTCFSGHLFQHLIETLSDNADKKFYNIAKLGGTKYGKNTFQLCLFNINLIKLTSLSFLK